jgi:cytochrome d ubiquinol oxidase subunit II
MDLTAIAFFLLSGLVAAYGVLDGFDLGVGALSLLARSRQERDLHVAAVAPVWDGNEVWLLASGNVLFGAFPLAFVTIFSGFYVALVLVLVALVARAVSIELRLRHPSPRWTRAWDLAFGLGSLVPAVLLGVAVGNVLRGVPIGPGFTWQGSFLGLLNPYALLVGLVSCSFFVAHGAIYRRMKTTGALAERLGRIALAADVVFLVLYAAATVATVIVSPFLFRKVQSPLFQSIALLLAAALVVTPLATRAGRMRLAFAASSATIALMVLVTATSAYPVLVPSRLGDELSLTIYNAASTRGTLAAILVVAGVGLPLVLGYTIAVYRVFRGTVRPPVEPA